MQIFMFLIKLQFHAIGTQYFVHALFLTVFGRTLFKL